MKLAYSNSCHEMNTFTQLSCNEHIQNVVVKLTYSKSSREINTFKSCQIENKANLALPNWYRQKKPRSDERYSWRQGARRWPVLHLIQTRSEGWRNSTSVM